MSAVCPLSLQDLHFCVGGGLARRPARSLERLRPHEQGAARQQGCGRELRPLLVRAPRPCAAAPAGRPLTPPLTVCVRPVCGSANHFQGGPSVDVFGANGSNPTANWKVSGTVQKVYDKALKSHVFVCDGGPTALTLPSPSP